MRWIDKFQLFLFDLDGLLVNSEKAHYLAYKKMCKDRGFNLPWSFQSYCLKAHSGQEILKKAIYETLPSLRNREPNWETLYAEKKRALNEILQNITIEMMPGAEKLLTLLKEKEKKMCVVTNSSKEQVAIIRDRNPILNTIPTWITRESYRNPKPDPECYLQAIAKVGKGCDGIVGFEDSPKGIKALLQTEAQAVLVTEVSYPEISQFIKQGVIYAETLDDLRIIDPH